ncbi:MAG TPA: hypothetical protein VNB94_07455, partial [Mycobacteriales bacterium]|nr:hypothetical protein [Mycobacteriales bacterium]
PPPAPALVTQLQPNPNPNPQVNPQPQLQPNVGMVSQQQEQIEVALATVDLEDSAEGQLAMSAVRSDDSAVQVAAALLAVGLTAGAAYGLGVRRRAEPAVVRVRAD